MGPRGPIGLIGSTGPHGPKGENGFVGIDGEPGPRGMLHVYICIYIFFLLVQAAPEHSLIHRPVKIYHFQDQQDLKENKEMDSRDNVDWTVKEEMKDQKE